jgi:hypothetical protein
MHSYVAQEGRTGLPSGTWNWTWTDLPDKLYPRQWIDLQQFEGIGVQVYVQVQV